MFLSTIRQEYEGKIKAKKEIALGWIRVKLKYILWLNTKIMNEDEREGFKHLSEIKTLHQSHLISFMFCKSLSLSH